MSFGALSFSGCASTPLLKPSYFQRSAYVFKKSITNNEIKKAILSGRVIKGMQKDDVEASWGKPTEKYEKHENKETWYYGFLAPFLEPGKRVLFIDDVVSEVYVSQN